MVPTRLQKDALQEFLNEHLGMAKMKALMRIYVFWSSMDRGNKKIDENVPRLRARSQSPPVECQSCPEMENLLFKLHINHKRLVNGAY